MIEVDITYHGDTEDLIGPGSLEMEISSQELK
jgi:hypothetical protein